MRNHDFHSFKVIRKDAPQGPDGPVFHLPKMYLDYMEETNARLKRIESLLETVLTGSESKAEISPSIKPKKTQYNPDIALEKSIEEKVEIPFLSMKFSNSPDFYKASRTFLDDIDAGKNSFGFQRFQKDQQESFISIFASFISYSRENMPVLIVVDSFEREEWKTIKKNFSIGVILGYRCFDWGNITVIEKKELLRTNSNDSLDLLKAIKSEFRAIFWSISSNGIHNDYGSFSYFIMESLNSVTLIVPPKNAKISDVVKAKSFYSDYKIPIKGLLNGQ